MHTNQTTSTTNGSVEPRPRKTRARIGLWLLVLSLFALTIVASPRTAEAQESGQAWTLRYIDRDPTFTDNDDFRFDAATGTYSAINAEFWSTTSPDKFSFTALRPGAINNANSVSFVGEIADDMTGIDVVELNFESPLTNAGGTIRISTGTLGTCNADCSEIVNPVSFDVGFASTLSGETNQGHVFSIDPDPNAAGWNNTDITVDFFWNSSGQAFTDLCDTSTPEFEEGENAYYASCVDGNASVMSLLYSFKIDKTAPETTITSGETTSDGSDATVAFEGSDGLSGLASFECSIDGGGYSGCTSPFIANGVGYGNHTVTVRAVDVADNADASPAEYTWVANNDASGPTAAPTFTPAAQYNGWHTNDVTVDFNWSDEAGGSGLNPAACITTLTTTGEGEAIAYEATCEDNVGNSSTNSGTLAVDKTTPEVLILSAPDPVIEVDTAAFEFSSSDNLTAVEDLLVECSFDGADFTPCTSPLALSALAETGHSLAIRSTDDAGLVATSTHEWVVAFPPIYTCLGYTATAAELEAQGFNVIVGTEEADELTGTGGADFIVALGGDDKIAAKRGNDVVCGGEGNDEILLGGGDDQASGGSGQDTITGNGGADMIYGGDEADVLNGGSGADEIHGEAGDDVLTGGRGNDVISAGAGTDECQLGRGADTATDCELVTSE